MYFYKEQANVTGRLDLVCTFHLDQTIRKVVGLSMQTSNKMIHLIFFLHNIYHKISYINILKKRVIIFETYNFFIVVSFFLSS